MIAQDSLSVTRPVKHKFQPQPLKATMMAVVLPGLGQIYNRKYWKIPLVYAGFGSMAYFISFNSTNYTKYVQATQDFIDQNPATNRFKTVPGLENIDPATTSLQNYNNYKDQLYRRIDYYKRYRDLSYIGIAAWYLASIIDANVDASLFNYDVSDNLDIAVLPTEIALPGGFVGAGLNVSLKIDF
jgi:hypothetical protein